MGRVRAVALAAVMLGLGATGAEAAVRTITGSVAFGPATFREDDAAAYAAFYNVAPDGPVQVDFGFTFDDEGGPPSLFGEVVYAVSHVTVAVNGVTAIDRAPETNEALLLTNVSIFDTSERYDFQLNFHGDLVPGVAGLEDFQFFYNYVLDLGTITSGVPTPAQLEGHIIQATSNLQVGARAFDPRVGQSIFYTNDGEISLQDSGVPEPATWALMIGGFGLAGGALRRRRAGSAAGGQSARS